jgi:hypothetical protein
MALLIRRAFTGVMSRRAGRFLLAAWLCFSVGPALHYLLIVHPLPQLPGILELLPMGATRLFGEAYFIGTVIVVASVWVALRHERRLEAAVPAPAIAA